MHVDRNWRLAYEYVHVRCSREEDTGYHVTYNVYYTMTVGLLVESQRRSVGVQREREELKEEMQFGNVKERILSK